MHETRISQHVHQSIKSIRWWCGGEMKIMNKLFLHRFMFIVIQIMRIQPTQEKKNQFYSSALWLVYICKHFMRVVCGSFARVFPTKWPYIGILWRLELERTLIFFIIIIITVIIIIIRAAWIALSSLFVCCCCMVWYNTCMYHLCANRKAHQVFCDILKNDLDKLNKRFKVKKK